MTSNTIVLHQDVIRNKREGMATYISKVIRLMMPSVTVLPPDLRPEASRCCTSPDLSPPLSLPGGKAP